MRMSLVLAAVLALAGCSRPAAPPPPPAAPPPVVTTPAPVVAAEPAPVGPFPVQTLSCAGGDLLEVAYPAPDAALLIWKGRAYTLKSAAAGQPRYAGEGLQWLSKGEASGALSTLTASGAASGEPVIDCLQAPPTVTGAPADKGSLAQTAVDVQAALGVARAYYALLGQRQSADAAKYRVDATPQNLSAYTSYRALLGAPGAIQAGAGVLRIEIPVSISGDLAAGGPFHKAGKVVLRRQSDAPGAAVVPREWRIERAP